MPDQPTLHLSVLGPLTLRRGPAALQLPASRKTRALLAYLALGRGAVRRERLCDMFWDRPADPRSALRWSLNRLRLAFGPEESSVLSGDREAVFLDRTRISVDGLSVEAAAGTIDEAGPAELARLAGHFRGEFLEGLDLPDCPDFQQWLVERRHAFRSIEVRIVRALVHHEAHPAETRASWARRLPVLDPLSEEAHLDLVRLLAASGRHAEADAHVETAMSRFRREGLPDDRLRLGWRRIRAALADGDPGGTTAGGLAAPDDLAAPHVAPPALDGERRLLSLPSKPSVAVLPFTSGGRQDPGGLGDAVAAELISRLARMRWLFVIARGSSFRYRDEAVDTRVVGRELGVRFLVTGSVMPVRTGRIRVDVDLCDAESRESIWSERFESAAEALVEVEHEILGGLVEMVATEIEAVEQRRALAAARPSLDAWGAFHRASWHSLRFTRTDNAAAAEWYDRAIELDPTLARAFAGRSATFFQRSFVHQDGGDGERDREAALRFAWEGLALDPRDAMVQTAAGRALWLNGARAEAAENLQAAVSLSPSYAFGHYAIGFVNAIGGDPDIAVAAMERAERLSPFDPLRFGMDTGRTLVHLVRAELAEAAERAVLATRRPNAHVHIFALAAMSLALVGRRREAEGYAEQVGRLHPGYRCADFLAAFDALPGPVVDLLRHAAPRAGLPG